MSSLTVSFAGSRSAAISPFAAAASLPLPATGDCYPDWQCQPSSPDTPGRPLCAAAPAAGNLDPKTAPQTEDLCDCEVVWRELSVELDSEDPLAAAAAAAARAAANQPESTLAPGVAARLRSLLPGLLRATLTLGSQTAVLALPPAEGPHLSGNLSGSCCSLSLPLGAAAAHHGGGKQRRSFDGGGRGGGSITFELAQPPNASLLRLLERFARLLSRRLGAERRHLAKAQLEDSLDEASEALSRGASLESATSSMLLAALRCAP